MGSQAHLSDIHIYRRLLRQARPYWGQIVLLFLIGLLAGPLALLTPLPLKLSVDSVVGSEPVPTALRWLLPDGLFDSRTDLLLVAAAMVVLVALLNHVQELCGASLRTYTGEKLVLEFRALLFRHVQRLSLAYHDMQGTADSTYRIQYDSASIQHISIDGIIPFITSTMTLLLMLMVTISIDWQLALVAVAISPILVSLARTYRKRLRKRSREVKSLESAAMSVVHEVLAAVRVVKAFGQEEREQERYVRRARESTHARLRLALTEGGYGLLVGVTLALGTAVVLFVGVRHVQSGLITLGELLLVMGYLAQIYIPLKTISRKATSLQSHFASAERAFALLDQMPDVPDRPDARPLRRAVGAMELRDVNFAYEPGRPVLHDVTCNIHPGTRVGIAGTTGAGKTTLISLLTRFYDPTSGEILLDGTDLREFRVADLRDQFAIVLQEPVLFSTSIAENIAYARPEATEEEIFAAAKAANAHGFIARLRDGYNTKVGERGMRLSGGERQRISLARAFLKDAPILILDEPTSSVDLKTEREIMEAMERLMTGRTTFMITHRLSTLEHCDLILEIEGGMIVRVRGRPGEERASSQSEPITAALYSEKENG